MEHIVRILEIKDVANRVKRFRLEKPDGYSFQPGQATDVVINSAKWKNELRPFTFTCLPEDPYLEFTIKRYPDHHGVTDAIHQLKTGDELILHDVWGAIEYKGPGYFIAGGAGITPFLAILRMLNHKNQIDGNQLFFSNQTAADIICEEELKKILGDKAMFILTKEKKPPYPDGYIDHPFLQKHITDTSRHVYVCGPDKMVSDINAALEKIGVASDTVVFEK